MEVLSAQGTQPADAGTETVAMRRCEETEKDRFGQNHFERAVQGIHWAQYTRHWTQ